MSASLLSSCRSLLALTFLSLVASPLNGAEVRTLLTCIADGDAKDVRLRAANRAGTFGSQQDEGFALLLDGAVPLVASDPGLPLTILLDRAQTDQTMLGHGAAMTDSSAWVLMRLKAMNPELYRYTMKKLFSPTEGAGFSFLRLPMGASDYTATEKLYTYCDEPSPDLTSFSIAHDQEYIIPALKEALRLNPEIRILASPWSAPAWMKTNGKLEGISAAEKAAGATNQLKPECFALYADYFVKCLEAYRSAGIAIWGVTLQNEPQFDAARYPCMRMNEDDQIRLVRCLGPKLAAKGLAPKIFIHDHNWALHRDDGKVVGGDVKLSPVDSVTKILSDPVAGPLIAGSAWHCYAGGVGEMKQAYKTVRERFPDKLLLCTEVSGWGKNRGAWFGDIDWGMDHNWLGGPQNGCSASLEWNLVLDHKFGPTLRPDSEATGLAAVNTDRFDEVRFEPEFYAMAQMSRAARPGSRRIGANCRGGDASGLEVVAFALPKGETSLAVFNKQKGARRFQVQCGLGFFIYEVPGRSIVTFVW